MEQIKLNILQGIKIYNSNKDFILYNLDNNNNIINYKLTNDYYRYKKDYTNFKVLTCVKRSIKTLTI